MKKNKNQHLNIQNRLLNPENEQWIFNINDVFTSGNEGSYLNVRHLFANFYKTIPNSITEIRMDVRKINEWFLANFSNEIKEQFYNKVYLGQKEKQEMDDIYYFLYEDLLIFMDTNSSAVHLLFKNTPLEKIEPIIAEMKKFKKRKEKNKPTLSVLVQNSYGLDLKSMDISRPKLAIKDNYNDDFEQTHQHILKNLGKKNNKGLVLLHGKPGTGKTSYIRYLISILKKEVIFMPPNMASQLTNPDLLSLLIENSNSVFVIEDAENLIIDRNSNGNSPVSAILNISDGLLSDCLNIQIICSFNTDLSKIDPALMRKGRLIARYEFKELEVEKAKNLAKKLGMNHTQITEPTILTDIYNMHDPEFKNAQLKPSIGFRF